MSRIHNKTKQKQTKAKSEKIFHYGLFIAFSFLLITIFVTQFNQNGQSFAKEEGVVTVYKSPTCGCCKEWVSHLEENGFKVKAVDTTNMSKIKQQANIPAGAGSCHTAIIDDYVIEGHVPADDIKKLLREKREVVGLTVPGMPMGSPGMEGNRVDNYSVYQINKQGKLEEVNRY